VRGGIPPPPSENLVERHKQRQKLERKSERGGATNTGRRGGKQELYCGKEIQVPMHTEAPATASLLHVTHTHTPFSLFSPSFLLKLMTFVHVQRGKASMGDAWLYSRALISSTMAATFLSSGKPWPAFLLWTFSPSSVTSKRPVVVGVASDEN